MTGARPDLAVDLRTKAGDLTSSIAAAPKPVTAAGSASLVVVDEDREGHVALVVVVDPAGQVVAQATTTVGG